MFYPSDLMINFISHTEYHWLSGSLCTHKWTCCLVTWHFLEFFTVFVEQGSWISFKNAKAQRNWRLNVNRDYQRKSQELHWYEAVSGPIVACAVSGTFSADVWNYSRYMKLKEDVTMERHLWQKDYMQIWRRTQIFALENKYLYQDKNIQVL